jgi:hypothetical protein
LGLFKKIKKMGIVLHVNGKSKTLYGILKNLPILSIKLRPAPEPHRVSAPAAARTYAYFPL